MNDSTPKKIEMLDATPSYLNSGQMRCECGRIKSTSIHDICYCETDVVQDWLEEEPLPSELPDSLIETIMQLQLAYNRERHKQEVKAMNIVHQLMDEISFSHFIDGKEKAFVKWRQQNNDRMIDFVKEILNDE